MLRWVSIGAIACAGLGTATANPFEVLGLTSRQAGQANTGVASADDAAALYYNPAGLVTRPGREVTAGMIGAYSVLRHGGSLADPAGAQLAVRTPLALRGPLRDRIVVGVALLLLPGDVAHVIAPAPDEPFYPYYGDRMSRIVVMPGAAMRFGRLAVGAALDILAGLGGTISATEGSTRAIDTRGDERIPTIARAILGATWQPSPALRLGAVFRQRFEVPIATSVETMVAGEPIDLDVRTRGQFAPHQLAAGIAYTRGAHVISGEVRYARWRDYRGPFVVVASTLPLVGDVPALSPAVPFEDTYGARAGIESRFGRWIARAGYGFETSPVPAAQTGVTNLLDGPRHTFALGAGRQFGRLRIDAHLMMQLVQSRSIVKELGGDDPFTSLRDEDPDTDGLQITNPGFPGIDSGGRVMAGGVTVEMAL
ncbi:MAG: hypothetical protein ABI867_34970 [Kofleriaceae bacterium]